MKITLQKLSTKELATLTQRVIIASIEGKYTIPEENELLQQLKQEYAVYKDCYTKSTYSGIGRKVYECYVERRQIFLKIRTFLNAYRKMNLLDNWELAEDLYQIIKRFGLNMGRTNYARASALFRKLIEELDKATNLEKLKTLQLLPYFELLKTKQQQFEDLYHQQAEANAKLRAMPSATVSRKSLEKLLRNYFTLLTAMKDIEAWSEIYVEINEIVKSFRYNTI